MARGKRSKAPVFIPPYTGSLDKKNYNFSLCFVPGRNTICLTGYIDEQAVETVVNC
jgi:hypothetical protein